MPLYPLCNEDVDELEDAWTDACENYGPDSPEAKAAWEEYEAARDDKREQDEAEEQLS
jgi:hypothetical protein